MERKRKGPIKGAGRKWAARLKELGQQKPPQALIDAIIRDAEKKKSATSANRSKDMDI